MIFLTHIGGIEMTSKELIKLLMNEKEISNVDMAKELEITPAALWDRLNPKKTDNMTISKLNSMLKILGYKVMVVPSDTELPENAYEIE